jgi:RND family efflux transporter MFP subunit
MHRLIPFCWLLLTGAAAAATPITTRPLAELLIYPERSAPAAVESLNDADLSAEITARVDRILVRVGDEVQAGDLLVELDCRDHRSRLAAQQAALSQLEAQHRLAASQLERARNLRERRGASEEEVEQRETELRGLDAQLAAQREAIVQAELDVERCTIRAPYRAAVTARLADEGTLATPGTHLLRVVETDSLELSARLRADELQEGRSAATRVFEFLGEHYPVEMRRTVPVIDPRTRTVEVRLTFPDQAPPAGAAGRLVWRSPTPHLPAELLVRRNDALGVFVASNGAARFHALPGAQVGQPAGVAGLPPDTRIVVAGRERLGDGAPVQSAE